MGTESSGEVAVVGEAEAMELWSEIMEGGTEFRLDISEGEGEMRATSSRELVGYVIMGASFGRAAIGALGPGGFTHIWSYGAAVG